MMPEKRFVCLGILPILLLGVLPSAAGAADFAPLPDYRIADATGRYYVVWKRLGGLKHFGEWGSTSFTIAERAPGSTAVTSARAYVENLDRYEPNRGGQHYKMLEASDVAVRPGDIVHGRGQFATPPRVVLVSSGGSGFVALDVYGPNLPMVVDGLGGQAVVAVSLEGKLRHAKKLSDLFSGQQIGRFRSTPASVSWLRGGWINESEEELVLLGGNDELRLLDLVSGRVREGSEQDVVRGLHSADPEAVKQALIVSADRRLHAAMEPAREILGQAHRRPDVRLRAAVALAVMGDRSGAELIRQTAAGERQRGSTSDGWDRGFQRAVAIEYLPEAIGPDALPVLAETLEAGRAEHSAAFRAMVKLGQPAVGSLGRMVARGKGRSIRLAAIGILGSIGPAAMGAVPELGQALEDDDPLVRIKAALALAGIDPKHQGVLSALRAGLRLDPRASGYFPAREAAAECLAQLGPGGISVLIGALENTDAAQRGVVASALAELGPKATVAAPALVKTLGDDDRDVRNRALQALFNMGSGATAALTEGLRSEDVDVRAGCAFILGKLGLEARPSIPPLKKALDEEDPLVRSTAAVALGQIDRGTTAGVATLIELLDHPTPYLRAKAAVGLGEFGPRARAATSRLVEALDDTSKVAVSAALALGAVAPDEPAVAGLLIEALGHADRLVRRAAAESLGRFPSAADEVVPALIDGLDDPDWHVPHLAATALGQLGPNARAAIPALTAAAQDGQGDNSLRFAAIEALGKLGPEAKVAVPALVEVLADPCAEVAGEAVKTLATLGPDAVRALQGALENPSKYARARAAQALGKIGPAAEPAVPDLIDALADADPAVGFYSERPLLEIGPAAVDGLITALRDRRAVVRAQAARILGLFGPTAKRAVDALTEALNDDDPYVRSQAAYALGEIRPEGSRP